MSSKPEIFILTGDINSGKTTALEKWSKVKSVGGILTPLVEGRRVAYDCMGTCYFPFEANSDDKNVISIGRYYFLQEAFDRMNTLLKQQSAYQLEWILVDEVGPLELEGKGLHESLIYLLENTSSNVLLVVRKSLLGQVKNYFNLSEVRVIYSNELTTIP